MGFTFNLNFWSVLTGSITFRERKGEKKLLIFFVVKLDEGLIDDSGHWFTGIPVKDSNKNGDNRQATRLEAVGVVDVAVNRGSTADVIVCSV